MNWIQRLIQKLNTKNKEVEIEPYEVPAIRRFAILAEYVLILPNKEEIHEAIFANNTACAYPPKCFENEEFAIVVACENRPEPLLGGLIDWLEI